MKNLFSIFGIVLILMSGMNIAVSKHFCQGEFAAMKVSLNGEMATCGMDDSDVCVFHGKNIISKDCCDNELTNIAAKLSLGSSTEELTIQKSLISYINYIQIDLYRINNLSPERFKDFRSQEKAFAGGIEPAVLCIFRI